MDVLEACSFFLLQMSATSHHKLLLRCMWEVRDVVASYTDREPLCHTLPLMRQMMKSRAWMVQASWRDKCEQRAMTLEAASFMSVLGLRHLRELKPFFFEKKTYLPGGVSGVHFVGQPTCGR